MTSPDSNKYHTGTEKMDPAAALLISTAALALLWVRRREARTGPTPRTDLKHYENHGHE